MPHIDAQRFSVAPLRLCLAARALRPPEVSEVCVHVHLNSHAPCQELLSSIIDTDNTHKLQGQEQAAKMLPIGLAIQARPNQMWGWCSIFMRHQASQDHYHITNMPASLVMELDQLAGETACNHMHMALFWDEMGSGAHQVGVHSKRCLIALQSGRDQPLLYKSARHIVVGIRKSGLQAQGGLRDSSGSQDLASPTLEAL